MRIQLPAVVSLLGGIYALYFSTKLRGFKVPDKAPVARAHLSKEDRQKKILLATRICIFVGIVMIAGAGMLLWLENSN